MKPIPTKDLQVVHPLDSLQSRITLLSEKGFLWREIAELTDLPKKLIKGLAKGEFVLTKEENDRLCTVLDETIDRLKHSVDSECPEQDIDAEDYEHIKIAVKRVTLFKGFDDDKMIVQIHGNKIHD
jgi:hypothetical protein